MRLFILKPFGGYHTILHSVTIVNDFVAELIICDRDVLVYKKSHLMLPEWPVPQGRRCENIDLMILPVQKKGSSSGGFVVL